MRAMSLSQGEAEGEANEVRNLNAKLDRTQELIDSLNKQLAKLKKDVNFTVFFFKCASRSYKDIENSRLSGRNFSWANNTKGKNDKY